MKDLFLIRHAKSSWTDQSLSDIDRPLNQRGLRQVDAMARPLRDLGALDGTVHVSHALRARQTMEGVLEKLDDDRLVARVHFDPELYTFRWKQLYRWLKHHAPEESALALVGHNPALSDLAEALTGAEVPDMVTGAVLHLRIRVEAWNALKKGKAEIIRYLPPKHASYRLFRRKAPNPPAAEESLKKTGAAKPAVSAGDDPRPAARRRCRHRPGVPAPVPHQPEAQPGPRRGPCGYHLRPVSSRTCQTPQAHDPPDGRAEGS